MAKKRSFWRLTTQKQASDAADSKASPAVKAVFLEVVENQLRDGTPPETKQTFDRLVVSGYTPQKARELIGCVLASEMHTMMQTGQPYDRDRYVAALQQLPELPWEE